jgi:hypothetical protein
MLCSQINFLIKAVEDRKLTKIMKRTANVVVAVARRHLESLAVIPSKGLHLEASGSVPG